MVLCYGVKSWHQWYLFGDVVYWFADWSKPVRTSCVVLAIAAAHVSVHCGIAYLNRRQFK